MADEIKKGSAEQPKSSKEKPAKAEKSSKEKKEPKAKKDSKGGKDSSKQKKGNIFVRMGRAIAKFFKDERSESKKIVWPDAKTVLKSTAVVIVVVAVLGVILWLIDTGLSEGIGALVRLAERVGSDAAAEGETTTAAAGAMLSGLLGF